MPQHISGAGPTPARPADITSASVPNTLAALHVNPDTGLTHAEVDIRREAHGYNEVAAKKAHPVLQFLGKFWGLSPAMLELVMILSAVLGHYSDLVVVSALLVINAGLSYMQERRAAGVEAVLRQRLQVNAHRARFGLRRAGNYMLRRSPRSMPNVWFLVFIRREEHSSRLSSLLESSLR